MKALILSAGLGTRLGNLTKRVPKPMIEVAGKPVLEHIVDHLSDYGIYNIIVNTHYLPEVIMNHFGSELLYTYEPELLGEERTISSIAKWVENEYLLVMNGDTLTNINLDIMFQISRGRNIRWMDKGVYAGTKILSPDYFKGKTRFADYSTSGTYWFDVGTPKGLKKARKYYEKKLSHLS